MAKRTAAGTPATVALTAAEIPFSTHTYQHDPAASSFGREAADALGVEPERVFKTLLAETEVGIVVGLVPVNGMLDLKSLAATVGAKRANLADPAVAERRTGYVVGGISPVGQKTAHPTLVDESALLFDTVFVSGGRRGLELELAPADLLAVTAARYAALAR